jgi:RNA polymerase sigma factor (sigma-70 family)
MTAQTHTKTRRTTRQPSTEERKARARRLFERPLEYMDHKSFRYKNAEAEILGPPPEAPDRPRLPKAPAGLPAYLAALYQFPLLTREQEAHYFRKFNYLKFRAAQLRDSLSASRPSVRKMDEIEELLREAKEIKQLLTRRNLRLVVSIARKYVRPGMNLFELVSDGNIALMRAIEKFDFSRGFKFSTYATWAIRRMFARAIPAEQTRLTRYRTGVDVVFADSKHEGSSLYEQERANELQRDYLTKILKKLDRRERTIIANRFGLQRGTEPQTLEQIGNELGVSKERIRQIERRALEKLREFAEGPQPEVPLPE